jgi:hypothetical protein
MTRNGKIARLPGFLRDELNRRLDNGEEGETLLPWLNAHPEVQRILKESFNGAPITKQNLSEWRQGGFREWEIRHELIDQARHLSESAEDMDEQVVTPLLAGQLAILLAARYAALLNSWDGQPDPLFEEKVRILRGLNRDIALLQKTMQQASQHKSELEKLEEEREQKITEQVKKETVAPIWAMLEREELAGILGGGERGRKMAEVITAVKYDLPPPKEKECKVQDSKFKVAQPEESPSNPVQPSPTESRLEERKEGGRKKEESAVQQEKSQGRSQTKSEPVQPSPTESRQNEPSPIESNPVQPRFSVVMDQPGELTHNGQSH